MNHVTETTYDPSTIDRLEPAPVRRISWGAVFAGLTTAVIIQLLLTLLGAGIGAATINPLQERAPGEGLGIGAAIWFMASTLIAMYFGGRVAGRFCGAATRHERTLHGVFTWATTTILSVILLATAVGSLLGGTASLLGSAAGTAVQNQSVQAAVQQSATSSPNNEPAAVAQTEQKAREAGAVAAKRVSQSALWSFFLLVLSGLAAAMGGRSSAQHSQNRYTRSSERERAAHLKPQFAKS